MQRLRPIDGGARVLARLVLGGAHILRTIHLNRDRACVCACQERDKGDFIAEALSSRPSEEET